MRTRLKNWGCGSWVSDYASEPSMSVILYLFKLRPGVERPPVDQLGADPHAQFEPLTPASVTADFARVIPGFRWEGHATETHHHSGDIDMSLGYSDGGLTFEGSATAWAAVARLIHEVPGWIALSPDTLTWFE